MEGGFYARTKRGHQLECNKPLHRGGGQMMIFSVT